MNGRLAMGVAVATLVLGSAVAWADDNEGTVSAEEESFAEEARPQPVRRLRVLEDPYQISSFYRSDSPSRYSVGYGSDGASRYPVASFYRQGGGDGRYSRYWSSNRRGRGGRYVRGRVRVLGGDDIFLFAPTLLGPVVPLAAMYR